MNDMKAVNPQMTYRQMFSHITMVYYYSCYEGLECSSAGFERASNGLIKEEGSATCN
ncbi:unnamed protein product [Candida parapsilosis]